jgi:hypothetical protein
LKNSGEAWLLAGVPPDRFSTQDSKAPRTDKRNSNGGEKTKENSNSNRDATLLEYLKNAKSSPLLFAIHVVY